MSPRVSIIVPNYNHARYLVARLDSILNQTFTDWELIILDDCSTDASDDVIRSYLEKANVSYHPNAKNSGSPFIQWGKGLELARGEFIWIAESDDVADVELLSTLVGLLESDPGIGVAYCQSHRIDSSGKIIGDFQYWTDDLDAERWKAVYVNDGLDECANYLLWKNTIPNASAVVFRKSAYAGVGSSPLDYRLCGDWLVWLILLQNHAIAYTPRCLNFFRTHESSVRETTKDDRQRQEIDRLQMHVLRTFPLSRPTIERLVRLKVGDWLGRLRQAPAANRWQMAAKGFWEYLPFFRQAPLVTARCFLKRHQ